MLQIIKKVPLPIAGVMLALAATGNLVFEYGWIYKLICGVLASCMFLLLVLKIYFDFPAVRKDFQNPVIASVAPTLSMAIMILATYVVPASFVLAFELWQLGLFLHIALMVVYYFKFIRARQIAMVFPSTFIAFVGILVASTTAPAFQQFAVGQVIFWFGLASYFVLLPIIMYRMFVVKKIPEPAIPVTAICAAPASLCLLAYLSVYQETNVILVVILAALSVISTFAVIIYLPQILKLRFYPSYAALGFPFVVSAIALARLASSISDPVFASIFSIAAQFEKYLAILMVAYVVVRYFHFLFIAGRSASTKPGVAV